MTLSPAGSRGRCVALAALLAQAACSSDAPAPAPLVMFDSAGVRIVESRAPTWRSGEEWTVVPEPEVVIGDAEGAPPYLLNGVVGAVRLADGGIVVANGSSNELRIYDAAGTHLRTVGGRGTGTGEFDALSSIHLLPGDSLAAWDGAIHRLTVFTSEGEIGREWTVTDLAVFVPPIIGVFNDGTLLSSTVRGGATGESAEEYRDTTLWVRIRPGTTRMDVIGRSLGPEQAILSSTSSLQHQRAHFGRASLAASAPDRWFAGENGKYEIRVASPSGELAAIFRRRPEPPPVDASGMPVQPTALRDNEEESEAAVRRSTEEGGASLAGTNSPPAAEVPVEESLPYFDRLLVDVEGNLWVRNYLHAGDTHQVWSIFDRPGRWLGDVETPAGVEVFAIGQDYVLGRVYDNRGVESVRLYPLTRPTATTGSP